MQLTRDMIMRALEDLNSKLAEAGVHGELCLFGGTAMIVGYSARVGTKDVDALFQPTAEIRRLAAEIAEEHSLTKDWLNDGVKGFVSANHRVTSAQLPQFSNLQLTMPVPEYLLAMKCMAGRIAHGPGEADDLRDIRFLVRHLGLKSAEEVLTIVQEFYPKEQISVKTQYLVEGIFEDGV